MLSPTTNTTRIRVPARLLLNGDVTGSNETVLGVSAGVATPRGKVEVFLEKAGRQRKAIWSAATVIVVRRASAADHNPGVMVGVNPLEANGITPTEEIPLSDRLPTFHELATFDAGKAWDRLSPEQQRTIGMLALRFGTVGQCEEFYHETIEDVRKGFMSSHWTPQVQATAVWPRLHIQLVASAAQEAFQALCDHFDPLWPDLFGWSE